MADDGGHDDRGDRDEHLGAALKDEVGAATVEAGERTDDDADDSGDDTHEHHHHERHLSAAHGAGEDVPTDLVLAERVLAKRRNQPAPLHRGVAAIDDGGIDVRWTPHPPAGDGANAD